MSEKKQSLQKREIIQNGIASIPLGIICGGLPGAIAVIGITAGMATIQEQKDEKLRCIEYERTHPVKKTYEEVFEENIERASIIYDLINISRNRMLFPYKYCRINSANRTTVPAWIEYGHPVDVKLEMFNTYTNQKTKTSKGKVYCKEEFLSKVKKDINNTKFKFYNFNFRWIGSKHKFDKAYTVDDGNSYVICF